MKKMTLGQFRNIRRRISLGDYRAKEELFTYDLSEIPSIEYQDMHIDLSNISLKQTRINLDFSVLSDTSCFEKVDFSSCHLENLDSLNNNCHFFNIDKDCFDGVQKEQYKELFSMEGDFNTILDGSIEVKEYRKMMYTVDRSLLDFATRKKEDLMELFGNSFIYFFLVDETLDNLLAFFSKTDKPILSREDFREYLFRFLKEEDMGKLSLENFYGITKYISEEELLEQIGYKLENCFSLFYKCGIKNLYELSIQYDSFLDDDFSYLNLGKSFQIMNNIMIKAPITNAAKSIANTDYIETFEKLQAKEKLESKEEVYAYLDSLLKVSFIEEENMYVYSSSFYKAFPRNFLVENELDFMEDGFSFFHNFYKSGNFFSFLLMAYEDKEFYNILKEKDIIIPQESFGFYYKYLGKEKVFPLLVEYVNSLKHISAYTMEKLLEEHYREKIDPNELLNKALYDCLKGSILWGRRISGLPKSFQDTYPQLFLKSTFPYSENIKKLFYEKRISADLLKKYPHLKEELLHVDLSVMLMNNSLPFSNCDDKNIYEILGKKFSNSEILDLMIAFGDTFDVAATLTETDYNLQGTKEEMLHTFYSVCREVIFKYHVSLWYTAPSDFIRENEDLFLDGAAPSVMCTEFYRKQISFMDLKKYNEDGTIVYLLEKAPVFFEHEFIREFVGEVFKRKVSSDKLYTLLGNYNYYIDDANTIAQLEARLNSIPTSCSEEEILYQLEECIVDKLYDDFVFENFDYDLDAIDFGLFKKRHPDVILDKKIDPDFRDICYCKQLTFRKLLSYPTIDIKDKNYAAFFENDISPLVKELDTEELFDLALYKGKAEVIDQMLNFNKAEAVIAWYEKHHFLPDVSVMLNLDINDSEKLLTNARKWSYLMKISNHKDILEYKEALFKASMIFGVFDHDDKGYNLLLDLISPPRKLTKEQIDTIEYEYEFNYITEVSLRFFKKVYDIKTGSRNASYYNTLSLHDKQKLIAVLRKLNVLLSLEEIHQIFGGMDAKYNKAFREFFFKNLKYAKREGRLSDFAKIERNFNKISSFNAGRKLTFDLAMDYVKGIKYENIKTGNISLACLASKSGYNEQDFNKLQEIYDYTKKRVVSSIPRICGKTEKYFYEIVRLDDPIALVIGELTDCCQKLHDAAESSMIHSATDKDGRIFVVRDKDNKIVAQSWVWRKNGTICFDNIEIPERLLKNNTDHTFTEDVLAAYQSAAKDIIEKENVVFSNLVKEKKLKEEESACLKVSKVTVGLGYNDIADTIMHHLEEEEQPILFSDFHSVIDDSSYLYLDSENQYILRKTDSLRANSHTNIYPYYDPFEIYKSTMVEDEKKVLRDLLGNHIYFYDEDIFEGIGEEYSIDKENIRILMNYNFVLIGNEKNEKTIEVNDIVIEDLVDNDVQEQLGYALATLEENYKKITYKDEIKSLIKKRNRNEKSVKP